MKNRLVTETCIHPIPSLPTKINLNDLNDNGKLFSDEVIAKLNKDLSHLKNDRQSKNSIKQKFGIIKLKDRLFAIYKGKKWNRELGVGTFSKVKLAQDLQTGEWFSLKIASYVNNAKEVLLDEYALLNQLGLVVPGMILYKNKLQLLRKYHPGVELVDILHDFKTSPARLLDVAIQACQQIQILHNQNIIHRDIKLENFIYDFENGTLALIDFGLAIQLKDSKKFYLDEEIRGTLLYIPPESYFKYYYNVKTDIYSLGIMLKLIFGFPVNRQFSHYVKDYLRYPATDFTNNKEVKDFLEKLTSEDSASRPSLDDTLAFLNKLKQQIVPINIIKLGLVDIAEYPFLTYSSLHKVDEIALFSREEISQKEILRTIQDLESRNIFVRNKYILLKDNDFTPLIEKDFSQDTDTIYDYYLLSDKLNQKQITDLAAQSIKPLTQDQSLFYENQREFTLNQKNYFKVMESLENIKPPCENYTLNKAKKQLKFLYDNRLLTPGVLCHVLENLNKKLLNGEAEKTKSLFFKNNFIEDSIKNLKTQMQETYKASIKM